MRTLLLAALLPIFTSACAPNEGDPPLDPIWLTREFYSWSCSDYENYSRITVETNTCEDRESGLYYLIAEYQLMDGSGYKRHLTKAENWHIDCLYSTEFSMIDEVCIQVDGVTLTAYVTEATWSGVLFGD